MLLPITTKQLLINPTLRAVRNWYWRRVESNALISAQVERQKQKQAYADAAHHDKTASKYENVAVMARSERNQS